MKKRYLIIALLLVGYSLNAQICRAVTDGQSGHSDNYGRIWVFPRLWSPGQTLSVGFLNGSAWQRAKVREYAAEWMKYANIHFAFVEKNNETADVRVAFNFSGDSNSWSKIGKDATSVPIGRPTIHFGWLQEGKPEDEIRRIILHEFGHVLGLQHELKSPAADLHWNKEIVYQYYREAAGWTREQVDHNVLKKLHTDFFSDFDPLSIMTYPVDGAGTKQSINIGVNTVLSELDKKFIGILYPFNDYYLSCYPGRRDEGLRYIEANPLQRCRLYIERTEGDRAILNANVPISPGTTGAFPTNNGGTSILIVEKKIGTNKYVAHEYQSVDKGRVQNLMPGDSTETNAAISYRVGQEACFWRNLRNIYLNSKKLNDGRWLWLENAGYMKHNKLPKNEPFLLSIRNPPLEGYFCLLELRTDQTVVVYFPNLLEETNNQNRVLLKGNINLTYVRHEKHPDGKFMNSPAFVNLSLEPDQSGLTTFVALISKQPRPLSDFLPTGHRAKYVLWDGITTINPWEIGPGFYKKGHPKTEMKGPDWLSGNEWSVGRLEVEVE